MGMEMNIDDSTSIKEFNAMLDTIYVVGGKWKMQIIYAICTHKHYRFTEIERNVASITSRMLARELKEMEMNKLISRTVDPESPVLSNTILPNIAKPLFPLFSP